MNTKEEEMEGYENPFEEPRFEEYEEEEFNSEVNNLIEWIEDLDYDRYVDNWNTVATSANPGVDPGLEEMDEELFIKDNEEYENKLKEHLYLFEEKSGIEQKDTEEDPLAA